MALVEPHFYTLCIVWLFFNHHSLLIIQKVKKLKEKRKAQLREAIVRKNGLKQRWLISSQAKSSYSLVLAQFLRQHLNELSM